VQAKRAESENQYQDEVKKIEDLKTALQKEHLRITEQQEDLKNLRKKADLDKENIEAEVRLKRANLERELEEVKSYKKIVETELQALKSDKQSVEGSVGSLKSEKSKLEESVNVLQKKQQEFQTSCLKLQEQKLVLDQNLIHAQKQVDGDLLEAKKVKSETDLVVTNAKLECERLLATAKDQAAKDAHEIMTRLTQGKLDLESEIHRLSIEAKTAEEKIHQNFKLSETQIQESLQKAKMDANQCVTQAKNEADILLKEAQEKSSKLIEDANRQAQQLTSDSQASAAQAVQSAQAMAQKIISEAQLLKNSAQADYDLRISEAEKKASQSIALAEQNSKNIIDQAEAIKNNIQTDYDTKLSSAQAQVEQMISQAQSQANQNIEQAHLQIQGLKQQCDDEINRRKKATEDELSNKQKAWESEYQKLKTQALIDYENATQSWKQEFKTIQDKDMQELRLFKAEEEKRVREALVQDVDNLVHFVSNSALSTFNSRQSVPVQELMLSLEKHLKEAITQQSQDAGVAYNPKLKQARTRFWVKAIGVLAASLVAVLGVIYGPKMLGDKISELKVQVNKENEEFYKQMRLERERMLALDLKPREEFQNSYVDNILYNTGYLAHKQDEAIRKQWTLRLSKFFFDELLFDDRKVVEFVPIEAALVRELSEIVKVLNKKNFEVNLQQMRAIEKEKTEAMWLVVGGRDNWLKLRERESQFFQSHLGLGNSNRAPATQ